MRVLDVASPNELHQSSTASVDPHTVEVENELQQYLVDAINKHPKPSRMMWVCNRPTMEAVRIAVPNDINFDALQAVHVMDYFRNMGYYIDYNAAGTSLANDWFLICWDTHIIASEYGLEVDSHGALRDPCTVCPVANTYGSCGHNCVGCNKSRVYEAYWMKSKIPVLEVN